MFFWCKDCSTNTKIMGNPFIKNNQQKIKHTKKKHKKQENSSFIAVLHLIVTACEYVPFLKITATEAVSIPKSFNAVHVSVPDSSALSAKRVSTCPSW